MAKLLIKYPVLLGILLLSGLFATNQEDPSYTSIKSNSAHAEIDSYLNNPVSFFNFTPPIFGNRSYEKVAEVNEIDGKVAYSKIKSTGTALIDTQFASHLIASSLSLHQHFSYFSFFKSRYILFCDIRI